MSMLDKLLLPSKYLDVHVYTTLTTTSVLMRMLKAYLHVGVFYTCKVPPAFNPPPANVCKQVVVHSWRSVGVVCVKLHLIRFEQATFWTCAKCFNTLNTHWHVHVRLYRIISLDSQKALSGQHALIKRFMHPSMNVDCHLPAAVYNQPPFWLCEVGWHFSAGEGVGGRGDGAIKYSDVIRNSVVDLVWWYMYHSGWNISSADFSFLRLGHCNAYFGLFDCWLYTHGYKRLKYCICMWGNCKMCVSIAADLWPGANVWYFNPSYECVKVYLMKSHVARANNVHCV